MKKLFHKSFMMAGLMVCALLLGVNGAKAGTFKDFAIQVNNQNGTLLTT